MALVVEDGTGKSDAESYASVAYADTYFSNRGVTAWDALTNKEALLRKATDYMLQVYRSKWLGYRKTLTQALDFPRDELPVKDYSTILVTYYPNDIVPNDVKNACCELALKANSGDLAPDIERKTKREKVGDIEVEYADAGVQYVSYRAIDNMLAPYLTSTGVMRNVLR